MKHLRLTVLAALLAFSASQAAFAQAPAPAAGGANTTTTTTADDGTVSNANSVGTTTTTTTTTTGGIAADTPVAVVPDTEVITTESTTLTNTGGEPVLMTLAGLAIAMSALAFRRKVQA